MKNSYELLRKRKINNQIEKYAKDINRPVSEEIKNGN